MSSKPNVSIVLSTYNQPAWLEKALWGWEAQQDRDFEVVIADDGSRDETRETIDRLREETGLAIRHVWHEDDGFRKSEILNKAIEASSGGYLVFSDGDCIPRADFIGVHMAFAEPGHFLSGGYFKLNAEVSNLISRDDVKSGRFIDPAWLKSHGVRGGLKMLKLSAGERLAPLLNATTTTKATWNGHNSSGFKSDLVGVNGFDERMGYGGQDRELGERLMNRGLRGKQIRHSTVCVHLDHGRPWRTRAGLDHNAQIRRATRAERSVWTEHGIRKAAQNS
ncbi:MAG: glycosyltransferase [bacterium]|nr:glycosyltransferase [bacterium]